ncbi:MAG: hypothetical protein HY703_03535 [Gemmatimonadetes bacterium]|nr:hypothetical protein [Gemmatimonadota bacterium]
MYNFAFVAQTQDPLWRSIIAQIPHDPAAFFVYALLAVSLYLLWRGSRHRKT